MSLPTRSDALNLLKEHVKEPYQLLHAEMVAKCLAGYADIYQEDKELWYITGLLHDLDYFEHPSKHPEVSLQWFKDWNFPDELIHAVAAHGISEPRVKPESQLAKTLIATDELCGLIYAYSLMRPTGMTGMEAKSLLKKFKDKAFAAKIDRTEIQYGVTEMQIDLKAHITNLIGFLNS